MKKLSLFALLLLSGCFATAEPMYLPDGSAGYRISCGNYIGTMPDCIEKAGDMCGPNGYQMFDQAGRALNADAQNQAVISTLNNTVGKQGTQQAMFIKCKTNDVPVHMTPAPIPPQVEVTPVPLTPTPVIGGTTLSAPASAQPPVAVNPGNVPIPLK